MVIKKRSYKIEKLERNLTKNQTLILLFFHNLKMAETKKKICFHNKYLLLPWKQNYLTHSCTSNFLSLVIRNIAILRKPFGNTIHKFTLLFFLGGGRKYIKLFFKTALISIFYGKRIYC